MQKLFFSNKLETRYKMGGPQGLVVSRTEAGFDCKVSQYDVG